MPRGEPLADSPSISAREVAVVALGAVLLAVAMTWPLAAHLGTEVPESLQDPLLIAWQIAWGGDALLHQPLDFFQANAFWPLENSLAFTDSLIGYAPAGLIGSGSTAAVVRHNLLHLFAHALPLVGVYLLGRELGLPRGAAGVAGVAFAYAPWRLSQVTHLHVLSSGGIPLALFLLLRGYRRRDARLVAGGWVVATWQLSLGFSLGLQLVYLLALLAAVAGVVWLRRGRPRLDRRLAAVTAAGVALLLGWGALQAQPYLAVADDHPEAERTLEEVAFYSPPVAGLVAAPESSRVWGGLTGRVLDEPFEAEHTIFPGALLLLLAVGGAAAGPLPRAFRLGLAAGAVLATLFALGPEFAGTVSPYRLLYEFAPGWEAIRTPGRLMTLTLLALALLAGAGAARLAAARPGRLAAGSSVLLVALLLAEGSGHHELREVPDDPPLSAHAAPVLHLPSSVVSDPLYMLWSTDSFPDLVNGYSGFNPRFIERVRRETEGFPDARSIAFLRKLGVRAVVTHPELSLTALAEGTPQEGTLDSAWRAHGGPAPGLRRSERGDSVLYEFR